tara:strand:- start:2847 stop:3212 length:366 start_codon:yes stop_codon:yes gene_type:complete
MNDSKALRTPDYLAHILEAVSRINAYVEQVDELEFLKNKLVQDAVIRNFEVIGEASQNINRHDSEFLNKYPDIPLNIAYEMRNALSHGYFKIDLEIVWRTIEDDLPVFQKKVEEALSELSA